MKFKQKFITFFSLLNLEIIKIHPGLETNNYFQFYRFLIYQNQYLKLAVILY